MKNLYYYFYLKIKGVPHPRQIRRFVCDAIIKNNRRAHWRKYSIAALYAQNVQIEDIAKEFNVTRERVRQILFRIYYDGRKGKYDY